MPTIFRCVCFFFFDSAKEVMLLRRAARYPPTTWACASAATISARRCVSDNSGSSASTSRAAPVSSNIHADSDTPRTANSTHNKPQRKLRRHPVLHQWVHRELRDEYVRDHRPPLPHVPAGWTLLHEKGSNRFDLTRSVDIGNSGPEHMHVIALMEIKQYESTYRADNGERLEEPHIIFSLFLEKTRWRQQSGGGGLEFTLTSIDQEMVLDNAAIHADAASFEAAKLLQYTTRRDVRDVKYRGPMISELDDDFVDEILDYLDERGVNNGFAEYIMAQAHYIEQQEYENWLLLLKDFAQ